MSDENPAAFKHQLGHAAAARLADALTAVAPGFDRPAFERAVDHPTPLDALELKARVVRLADALDAGLPGSFNAFARAAVAALPPPVNPDVPGGFGFWLWPLVHATGRRGLATPEAGLDALCELTRRFSAEFDVRPYLERYPALTLARLAAWRTHPDANVRRWVSEGTRPRLPWGQRLDAFVRDPEPTLALIAPLRDDPSAFVRRSVANHLGDIAKDHPDRVVAVLRGWLQDGTPPPERVALARHAVRHLIKAGHVGALALFGHAPSDALEGALEQVSARVAIGQPLAFTAVVTNRGADATSAAIDYVVHYCNAAGALTRRRVFKLTTRDLAPGETARILRRQPMRPVSIRALFPGEHALELQVSGRVVARATFTLTA